jgi:hypothetical protein
MVNRNRWAFIFGEESLEPTSMAFVLPSEWCTSAVAFEQAEIKSRVFGEYRTLLGYFFKWIPIDSNCVFNERAEATPRMCKREQNDFSMERSQIGKFSKYKANGRGRKFGMNLISTRQPGCS